MLVKGSLHTDELLGAVLARGSGLRTERRISHVYAMDVPAYAKPIVVTDAAINIMPSLEEKRDICQNAIDLLRTFGIEEPLVAVLAAVETINTKMPATLDAAALEAGNMLAKQLIYFAGATAAGLVLGARVPIVLTSRADPLSARIASVALAKLVAATPPNHAKPSQ